MPAVKVSIIGKNVKQALTFCHFAFQTAPESAVSVVRPGRSEFLKRKGFMCLSVRRITKSLHFSQRGKAAGLGESLRPDVRNLRAPCFRSVPRLLPACCHRGPYGLLFRLRHMERKSETHTHCISMPENVHKRALGCMFMRRGRTVRVPFAGFEKRLCQAVGAYCDFLSAREAFCLLFSSAYRRMKVASSHDLSVMRACSSLSRRAFCPCGNHSLR